MAKQQRMSRKEVLSQLDPSEMFAIRVSMAIDWAKENLRYILYGISGIVVVAILVIVWTSWQGHRHEQASILLHQALKLVDEESGTEQVANPDQAIEKLQVITEKYGRTPAGARAFWHLGHLYFNQGKMSEALKAYQVARRRMPNRQPLSSTLAILNMGYAQEATDDCGEAISSYESVQQSPIRWLHGEAYLGMGRCHEKVGDTEKAIEVYDRALADVHITDAAQQTISERLARLQPEEPAPTPASATSAEPSEASEHIEKNDVEDTSAETTEEKIETENTSAPAPTETTAASQTQAPEQIEADQPSSATEGVTQTPETTTPETTRPEATAPETSNPATDESITVPKTQ